MTRRLKKPIRRTLMGIGVCAEVASAIALSNGTLFVKQAKVQAQANPKEVINLIAKMKNNDLSKMKSLKSYVLDTYQTVNMIDDIDSEESKVLLVTPTVVTQPSVENSSIVIVPVATSETSSKTEEVSEEAEASLKQSTNISEKEGDSQGGSSASPDASESAETQKASETSNSGTTLDASEKSEKAVEEKIENTTETTDNPKNKNVKEEVSETPEKSTTEDENVEEVPKESRGDDIVTTPVNDFSVIELVGHGDEEETLEESLDSMELLLKQDKVTIEDGSEFVAEDFIETIEGCGSILPTLKISGKVDSYTDGEYKVTYTLVGANGNTVSKDLTVVVKGNEEAKKAREEARQKAINEFVEKYTGKHIDVDGYYGDQCWDLWGRFICDLGLYSKYDCGTGSYGYAYGVYLRYDKTNAKKYFEKIENVNELKEGDWLFWDKGSSCPDSHVALLLKNNGDGTGECLTQSYGEGTRVMTLKLDVMGGFRPIGSADWYKLQ